MSHNLTDVDTFTSAVTVPDGGDDRTAASVEIPLQAVANRTRNNKNRLDGLGVTAGITVSHAGGIVATAGDVRANQEFEYCDAAGAAVTKQRVKLFPITGGTPLSTGKVWSYVYAGGETAVVCPSPDEADGLAWEMPVPSGAVVSLVRLGVLQLFAAVDTNMKLEVMQTVQDKTVPFSSTVTTSLGVDSTTALGEDVLSVPISYTQGASNVLVVKINASNSGAGSDAVFWIELTFSDPGPRNF